MGGHGASANCASVPGPQALPRVAGNVAVDGVAILVAIVVLALLALLTLSIRRQLLLRGQGTIDCSLRHQPAERDGGWVVGVARYDGDLLKWFRVFSLSGRPAEVVSRRGLSVRGRRTPGASEALAVNPGAVVVAVSDSRRELELAMSEGALTGFLAWLESAPPGAYIDHIT